MKDKEIIREKLLEMLNNKYKVSINKSDNIYDLNLLGKIMRMGPSDLMTLFLDVEKQFNIVISEEDIIEGRFKTINSITELIFEKTS